MTKTQSYQKQTEDTNLVVMYWNCSKGIAHKLSIIKTLINKNRPDIFFITESEIKTASDYLFYNIKGYDLEMSKTIERGMARIAAYVKRDSGFIRKKDLEEGMEVIVLDHVKIRLVGAYKPFKLQERETKCQQLEKLLQNLYQTVTTNNGKPYLCGGDFNIDWNKNSSMKSSMQEWADDCDLKQEITTITRYRIVETENGPRDEKSILDHIYTNISPKIEQFPTAWSDHEYQVIKLPIGKKAPVRKKLLMRDWRAYSVKHFTNQIHQGQSYKNLIYLVKTIYDKYVPLRVVRFRPDAGQVADTGIAKIVKKRDRYLKKYKLSNDIDFLIKAQRLAKTIKKLVRSETRNKIQTKLKSPDPKVFWNTIKTLTGRQETKPMKLVVNGSEVSSAKDIANHFVNFFTKKVEDLVERNPLQQIPPIDQEVDDQDLITFTIEDVKKAASKLKNKKCYGSDEIPLKIVKDLARVDPELLLAQMNNFARNGLPDELKTSRIIPLHKKGSTNEVSNYRPIANLNSFSKLYEKLVLEKLQHETEGAEGSFQHGYRKSHSTTTALLEIQSRISSLLEAKKKVAMYSMDLSAAFDVLRPDIMDVRLRELNITHHLRKIIKDFLTHRKIYVDIEGHKSELRDLKTGCVQGSILGPRLFTLYLGGLVDEINYSQIVTYADDSYVIIDGDTTEEIQEKVSTISTCHVNFLKAKGMIVNPDKTEIIVFERKFEPIIFKIDGTNVESTKTIKALGLTFKHDLQWDVHVENKLKTIRPKLSMLKKIGKNLDKDQFLKIATAQLYSILYYASPVWLNRTLSASYWTKIRSLHYRILRGAIKDYKKKVTRPRLDKLCKRATPDMWSKYTTATAVIKTVRDGSPSFLMTCINTTLYTTRRKPEIAQFYNNSRGKIGLHNLSNRIDFMNGLEAWLTKDLNDDAIRITLKGYLNFDFSI